MAEAMGLEPDTKGISEGDKSMFQVPGLENQAGQLLDRQSNPEGNLPKESETLTTEKQSQMNSIRETGAMRKIARIAGDKQRIVELAAAILAYDPPGNFDDKKVVVPPPTSTIRHEVRHEVPSSSQGVEVHGPDGQRINFRRP